ncbi:CHASE2 domain-containing protein [Novosphingobium rosa]|uniref:CHASE2 domain-containing protein n=1 Tax=Novosphingobium rosa TaxID=76978 RepID=UPI00082E62AB|nr:CHASE2 domain-containing protein [Novosphingobium rosa]
MARDQDRALKRPYRRLLLEWSVILCFAGGIAAALAWTGGARRLDNQIYDRLIRWRAPPVDPRIQIVAIDDDSLKRLGAWPWRRDLHARLIERLSRAGATLIAYDVLFVEPTPDDAALGQALSRASPVIAPMLFQAPGSNGAAVDAVPPIQQVRAHAQIGHVDLEADSDGLIRHIALSESAGVSAPVPHLMELAYRRIEGHPSPVFTAHGAPVLLPYARQTGAFPTAPFASVLAGEVPDVFLRGKIVLVGATATGVGDRYPTPLPGGAAMPGVELQAHLLNAMLAGRMIRAVPPLWLALISVLPVLALMLGFWRWTPAMALRCSLAAILLVLGGSAAGLLLAGWWAPPGAMLAGLLLAYPLWGWRRLQAISDYVDAEIARFAAEKDLALPRRERALPTDVIEAQTQQLAGAIDRIRDIRRFATDTIEHLPDAVLVAGVDERVTLANAAAIAMMGGNLAGFLLSDILAAITLERHEDEITTADGRRVVIARARLEHANGQHSGWIVRLVDITPIREAERTREEVLQLLSHDMRSPQASIITMVEGPQGADLPRDLAGRIARHARRTMTLADGFVQLARAQAAPFEPVEIMLADMLIEAADDLLPLAREKGVGIVLDGAEEPVFLMAEPQMLLRAFTNLIDNAVKYSPQGSTITCAIQPGPGAQEAEVSIRDQGEGMPDAVRRNLFGRFVAGNGKEKRSAGLGLAFVKTVMDRHGATIACESGPGGTTFTMRFDTLPDEPLPVEDED